MARPTPVRDSVHSLSLLWRATLASATVLGLVFILLLLSPVTVSAPIRLTEAMILTIGLLAMLAVNLILVRRALAPLRDLQAQMDQVDLRNPELRLAGSAADSPELVTFTSTFNAMLDRLAEERRAGSRAALLAQERERLRIARALHDEAGQTLTAIALEIERAATDGPPAERERMAELAVQLHVSLERACISESGGEPDLQLMAKSIELAAQRPLARMGDDRSRRWPACCKRRVRWARRPQCFCSRCCWHEAIVRRRADQVDGASCPSTPGQGTIGSQTRAARRPGLRPIEPRRRCSRDPPVGACGRPGRTAPGG